MLKITCVVPTEVQPPALTIRLSTNFVLSTTTTTTALFSPQMLKIIIVYSRFTQLQNKEDHGHPKIAGASRVK